MLTLIENGEIYAPEPRGRGDILFVDEVIGAGEIAISDLRATEPDAASLARLVSEAYIG
jgi:hypothetical protein